MEHSNLPQRGKGAEAAEFESILCSLCLFAPLRQTEQLQTGFGGNKF